MASVTGARPMVSAGAVVCVAGSQSSMALVHCTMGTETTETTA